MKNNKGFSLIELLAVLTILALLGLVTFQVIDGINKKNKEQAEAAHRESLLASAIAYVPTSDIGLPDVLWTSALCSGSNPTKVITYPIPADADGAGHCTVKIFLKVFSEEGIIDEVIKNPRTKECVKINTSFITIRYTTELTSISESDRNVGRFDGPYFYKLHEETVACD